MADPDHSMPPESESTYNPPSGSEPTSNPPPTSQSTSNLPPSHSLNAGDVPTTNSYTDQTGPNTNEGVWTEVHSHAKPGHQADIQRTIQTIEKLFRLGSTMESSTITRLSQKLETHLNDGNNNLVVVMDAVAAAAESLGGTAQSGGSLAGDTLLTVITEPPVLTANNLTGFADEATKWLRRITGRTARNRESLDDALTRLVRINQPEFERFRAHELGSNLLAIIENQDQWTLNPARDENIVSAVHKTLSIALHRVGVHGMYKKMAARRKTVRTPGNSVISAAMEDLTIAKQIKGLFPKVAEIRAPLFEAYAALNLRATPYGTALAEELEARLAAPDGPNTLSDFIAKELQPRSEAFVTLAEAEKRYSSLGKTQRSYLSSTPTNENYDAGRLLKKVGLDANYRSPDMIKAQKEKGGQLTKHERRHVRVERAVSKHGGRRPQCKECLHPDCKSEGARLVCHNMANGLAAAFLRLCEAMPMDIETHDRVARAFYASNGDPDALDLPCKASNISGKAPSHRSSYHDVFTAIPDLGNPRMCCGITWYDEYTTACEKQGWQMPRTRQAATKLAFGDAEPQEPCFEALSVPFQLKGAEWVFQTNVLVVPQDVGLLFGKRDLTALELDMKLRHRGDAILIGGVECTVDDDGMHHHIHLCVPSTKLPKRALDGGALRRKAIISHLVNPTVDENELIQSLPQIHKNMRHPSATRLLSFLRRCRGVPKLSPAIKRAVNDVTSSCPVCREADVRAPLRPRVAMPTCRQPGEHLHIDVGEIAVQGKTHSVLVGVDRFSGLVYAHVFTAKPNQWEAAMALITMTQNERYVRVLADRASYFTATYFAEVLSSFGIELRYVPAGAHWGNTAEKGVDLLRAEVARVEQPEKLNVQQIMTLAVASLNGRDLTSSGRSRHEVHNGRTRREYTVVAEALRDTDLPPGASGQPTTETLDAYFRNAKRLTREHSRKQNRARLNAAARHKPLPEPVQLMPGDTFIFMRTDAINPGWRGPAVCLGTDGTVVAGLLGGRLVTVHVTRTRLVERAEFRLLEPARLHLPKDRNRTLEAPWAEQDDNEEEFGDADEGESPREPPKQASILPDSGTSPTPPHASTEGTFPLSGSMASAFALPSDSAGTQSTANNLAQRYSTATSGLQQVRTTPALAPQRQVNPDAGEDARSTGAQSEMGGVQPERNTDSSPTEESGRARDGGPASRGNAVGAVDLVTGEAAPGIAQSPTPAPSMTTETATQPSTSVRDPRLDTYAPPANDTQMVDPGGDVENYLSMPESPPRSDQATNDHQGLEPTCTGTDEMPGASWDPTIQDRGIIKTATTTTRSLIEASEDANVTGPVGVEGNITPPEDANMAESVEVEGDITPPEDANMAELVETEGDITPPEDATLAGASVTSRESGTPEGAYTAEHPGGTNATLVLESPESQRSTPGMETAIVAETPATPHEIGTPDDAMLTELLEGTHAVPVPGSPESQLSTQGMANTTDTQGDTPPLEVPAFTVDEPSDNVVHEQDPPAVPETGNAPSLGNQVIEESPEADDADTEPENNEEGNEELSASIENAPSVAFQHPPDVLGTGSASGVENSADDELASSIEDDSYASSSEDDSYASSSEDDLHASSSEDDSHSSSSEDDSGASSHEDDLSASSSEVSTYSSEPNQVLNLSDLDEESISYDTAPDEPAPGSDTQTTHRSKRPRSEARGEGFLSGQVSPSTRPRKTRHVWKNNESVALKTLLVRHDMKPSKQEFPNGVATIEAKETGCVYGRVYLVQQKNKRSFVLTEKEARAIPELEEAIKKEIQAFRDHECVEDTPLEDVPRRANIVSTRWVFTMKYPSEGGRKIKARLVARGFQDREKRNVSTNAPTAAGAVQRLVLTVLAQQQWIPQSWDFATAFLQGSPITREIYIAPPVEATPPGIVWKLRKPVYGLVSAPNSWYHRLKAVAEKAGFSTDVSATGLLTLKDESGVQGVVALHVDDAIGGGTPKFQDAMDDIGRTLKIGSHETADFTYMGLQVHTEHHERGFDITLDGHSYIQDMDEMTIPKRDNEETLTSREMEEYRHVVGSIGYVASSFRPDVAYDASQLGKVVAQATVRDGKRANAVVEYLKAHPIKNRYRPGTTSLTIFHDGSGPDPKGSQGGRIAIFSDRNSEQITGLVHWESKKVKRVCRSTATSEVLSAHEAYDTGAWIRELWKEVTGTILPVHLITDNHGLVLKLCKTSLPMEKRLSIDLCALRQGLLRREFDITWIPSEANLADCLTKGTKSGDDPIRVSIGMKSNLLSALATGLTGLDKFKDKRDTKSQEDVTNY